MNVFKVNLILGYILLTLHFVSPVTFRKFSLVGNIGNKVCLSTDRIPVDNLTGNTGNGRLSTCLHFCTIHEDCQSIFYDGVDLTCTGCTGQYNVSSALEESLGTTYYVMEPDPRFYQEDCLNPGYYCVEPNQECFTDKCICSLGYRYNPGTCTCADSCTSYGTTFQFYPGWRIYQDNVYIKTGLSLFGCVNECIAHSDCVSFEFKAPDDPSDTTRCNIQNVTVATTINAFTKSGGYSYYARDCE